MKYKTKLDTFGHPIRTRLWTLNAIESFLGHEYDAEDWEEVIKRPEWPTHNANRMIVAYALREASRAPDPNRTDQVQQLCRRYSHAQPLFWPRFLRERYPFAHIQNFFSVPHSEIEYEFYDYEQHARDSEINPNETGKVLDYKKHFSELKATWQTLGEKMDMNKALR